MDPKKRANNIGKENNYYENVSKRDNDSLNKKDRLLMIKKINHEDKDLKALQLIKNSKELRFHSKSVHEKTSRTELKPITELLTNTQQYCLLYASNILEQSEINKQTMGSFLNKHDIDKNLRARMLDWMIEVISSYKFSQKTYFSSVYLMDRYFKAEEHKLPITKLHIIGVVSMLIATKMDQVYPLKIKTVYQKIVHKKLDKKDLIEMEARIANKLDFILNVWSFYDLAILKLHENWQLKNEQIFSQIEKICEYIGKFIVFNYELFGHYDMTILSESLLRAACKIYGAEKIKLSFGDKHFADWELGKDCIVCIDLIFQTMKTFKSNYKNLNNIYKFSQPSLIQKVEEFLKNY